MGDDNLNSSKKCDTNKCDVLIIGGGMAGLAAANELIKNGMDDFRILEARKRIGGRIISIPLKNHNVELGANWIHGVLGNPIFEIAMANSLVNIINIPKPHKVIAATEDGKQVPFGVLHEIHEAYVVFLRRCEEYFLCQYLPPPDIHSVGEHINLEATIYLERLPDSEEKKLRRLIFDCLLKRETCISGCNTMDEIDLLELGSYTELQGGNIMIPKGYSSILEPMLKNIPPEKIISNHPVKKIVWDSNQHSSRTLEDVGEESEDSDQTVIEDISKTPAAEPLVNPSEGSLMSENAHKPKKKSGNYVEVTCENGEKFYANHVICTIPLGVLKDHAKDLFHPALPQYKMESIERLLFGTVNKIFLEYDRPFLNPDITEIMLLWESTATPEDMAESWYKKIYSFSKVTETLLLGWVSGKEAEYAETLSMEQVAATCTKILRKFLNDPFIPEPQKCVCTSWNKQPYTRGSYTALAVGSSQTDIECLAQPLFRNVHDKKPPVNNAGQRPEVAAPSTSDRARPAVPNRNQRDMEQDPFTWSSDKFKPTIDPFDDFTSGVHQEANLPTNGTEFNFFQHFLDMNIMTQIVHHINQYHNYFVLNADLSVHSRLKKWYDVTVAELYIFLALFMLMTRNRHLTIEEHWSTDPLLLSPIFANLMSRNRFCTILGMLHFSTPRIQSESRLGKIELVINHAREKFKNLMTPFQNICIDESIVPFKGRISLKQYLPNKRNRFGIKLFVLCDVVSGIILDFIVYCGGDTEIVDPDNLGVGGAVVSTLIKHLFGSNRHLYVDNWYTSPRLFNYLHKNKIYACGTAKATRKGMPKMQQKLKRGELVFRSAPPLNAIKWHDKKDVNMLTTIHEPNIVPSLKEDRTTGLPVMKPECILDYSKNMGSVDTADMMLSSLQCIRKTIKWYKKLFFHVIDMHMLNAFYTFRLVKNTPKTKFAEFQLAVIRQMISTFNNLRITETQVPRSVCIEKNPLKILPYKTVEHMPTKQEKYRRCKECAAHKIRRESRFICKVCNVHLCVSPCFYNYHNGNNVQ